MIEIFRPKLVSPSLAHQRFESVWRSNRYSNFGPQVREFEERSAHHFDVEPSRVVSTTNATIALLGAMAVSGASSWRLPSWTFAATASAVASVDPMPHFVDVSRGTWIYDGKESATETAAWVQVLPFGAGTLQESEIQNQFRVIDAAASFGTLEGRLSKISPTDCVVISFHATKVLGVGEGGLAVFGDPHLASEFRTWTNFGFGPDRISSISGSNGKMMEYVAAMLNVELDHWEDSKHEWEVARELVDNRSSAAGIVNYSGTIGAVSPYWVAIFSSENQRDFAKEALSKKGIESRKWWSDGCHTMPAFRRFIQSPLPVTREIAAKSLGLPFFRDISESEVELIIETLLEATNSQPEIY